MNFEGFLGINQDRAVVGKYRLSLAAENTGHNPKGYFKDLGLSCVIIYDVSFCVICCTLREATDNTFPGH